MTAHANAGVPSVWTIDQKTDLHEPGPTTYRLEGGRHVVADTGRHRAR